MAITFRRLEVFVAAATEGNFRKTADRLGISQPSVSAQIRAIETHLGYELFERRCGGSATLSRAGRSFLTHARDLVHAEGNLAAERLRLRKTQSSVLRVSAGPILLEKHIKPVLMAFQERYPNILLDFVPFDPATGGEKAIATGAVDVLLYTGGPPQKSRSQSETVTRVGCSLYAAASSSLHLAQPGTDVSGEPFLMTPRHYRISTWLDTQLAAIGIRPRNVVARPPYMDVVLQMVCAGQGIGALFDEHAAESVARGLIRALPGSGMDAYRVMLFGRRALRPESAPALQFLRSAVQS